MVATLRIKNLEELSMEYASKGVAGSGLGLGIAGTALGLLNGGLGGIIGNGWNGNGCGCSENTPVNRYELNMSNELAAKDGKIALLESNIYTDQKIVDTYTTLNGQINALAAEVRANKDTQNGINLQQAVYNGTNTAALECLQGQVARLYNLTALRIPNTSICPGWGDVTVTPAAAPTTAG
jgi:hypothetical protein